MSSMVRAATSLLLLFMAATSVPARCQEDGTEWDAARARLMATQRGTMGQAIERWRVLSQTDSASFSEYAGFLLTYPGFPDEAKMRVSAERALSRETVDYPRLIAFFDRVKPVTNPAKALYALALTSAGRPEAKAAAIAAWRGGSMSDTSAAALFSRYSRDFSSADHDARMDALLWAGDVTPAQAQMAYVSAAGRNTFAARLALIQGTKPESIGIVLSPDLLRDPGYIYNRVRQLKSKGDYPGAQQLLLTRPAAATPPLDPGKWIAELLSAAKGAGSESAVRIASSVDDSFAPGTDVSKQGFKLRDDYTSLMWLGGTRALNALGDGPKAASLFYRYGAAAKTPQTRSKGFYWAGRALAQRGDTMGANRYFEQAAVYADQYYGMLALERLGRPLPNFNIAPTGAPTAQQRAAFDVKPLTAAVREVSRDFDWSTSVRFFREISDAAVSESDHLLVADLARNIGRRDLAVILGQTAGGDGLGNFQAIAFPVLPNPPGTDWTMVHAISRQESQFAQNAISHAGARGLMQLMPGTAREQSNLLGLSYAISALTADPSYNMRLGDAYFGRLMTIYNGSYPLSVAAYNAGPGNVNRWLRDNGDPRNGSVDWIDWIERIPLSETRGYVQHVLENAVVYEAMNPSRARTTGANPLSRFLGKNRPG
jgi:soluble lytic murein transglycosylase